MGYNKIQNSIKWVTGNYQNLNWFELEQFKLETYATEITKPEASQTEMIWTQNIPILKLSKNFKP